jgi:hypothetical protein
MHALSIEQSSTYTVLVILSEQFQLLMSFRSSYLGSIYIWVAWHNRTAMQNWIIGCAGSNTHDIWHVMCAFIVTVACCIHTFSIRMYATICNRGVQISYTPITQHLHNCCPYSCIYCQLPVAIYLPVAASAAGPMLFPSRINIPEAAPVLGLPPLR